MTRTKQPESLRQRQAYEAFLSQPHPRRIKALAPQIGIPWRTLFDWQRRYDWRGRVTAHDTKLIKDDDPKGGLAEGEDQRKPLGTIDVAGFGL